MDFQEKIKVLAEEWQGNNEKRCVLGMLPNKEYCFCIS